MVRGEQHQEKPWVVGKGEGSLEKKTITFISREPFEFIAGSQLEDYKIE